MELKKGDVVLVTSIKTDIYGFFIKIGNLWTALGNFLKFILKRETQVLKYTHIGIMVDNDNIVEALSPKVLKRKFPYDKNFEIYRMKNLTDEQREKLKKYAEYFIDMEYAWGLIVCLAIFKILRLEWLFNGLIYKGIICSVLIAKVFEKALGYKFCYNQAVDLVDPMDIAENILISNKEAWEKIK